MDTHTKNRIQGALNTLQIEITGDGPDDYTIFNRDNCIQRLRATGLKEGEAEATLWEFVDAHIKQKRSKQYWLITTRDQYIHDSKLACISTNVYEHGPAKVLLDCQKCAGKESGYSDTQILFAVQITKQEYDDYKKWEDSL